MIDYNHSTLVVHYEITFLIDPNIIPKAEINHIKAYLTKSSLIEYKVRCRIHTKKKINSTKILSKGNWILIGFWNVKGLLWINGKSITLTDSNSPHLFVCDYAFKIWRHVNNGIVNRDKIIQSKLCSAGETLRIASVWFYIRIAFVFWCGFR